MVRSFCSWPSNKKSWKQHSRVRTKGTQKKKSFHRYLSASIDDSQISSIPELSSAFQAGFLTPPGILYVKLPKTSQIYSHCLCPRNCSFSCFSLLSKPPYHLPRYPSLKLRISSRLFLPYHFKLSRHQVLSLLPCK